MRPTSKNHKRDGQKPRPDGQLRQSQLVGTFGPGAMIDLIDRAVLVGGLEHWGGTNTTKNLDEPRLRRSLVPRLKALDPDLELASEAYFRMPPEGDPQNPLTHVGVRALEFPRWFVCQGCRRLARASDAFEKKGNGYRHNCGKNKSAKAVPVRFVAACQRGHLSDFPWVTFAHMDRSDGVCDRPELYLDENAIGDVGRIVVRCANCDAKTSLNRATGPIFTCHGERPWLGGRACNESCDQKAQLLVRSASNAYFGQVVSALRLPEREPSPIELRIDDLWRDVEHVSCVSDLETLARLLPRIHAAFDGFKPQDVAHAITARRAKRNDETERPLRVVEFERMVSSPMEQPGVIPPADAKFAAYRVARTSLHLPAGVAELIVVPELREVRVQVSFSRFDSVSANLQGEYDFAGAPIKPAVLTLPTGNEKWLPAAEVRGEGFFVRLDLDAVRAWENSPEVQARAEQLLRGFEAGGKGVFPGVRFYMLHSLSHLLLTAISLECGYAASAIRERIYCGQPEEDGTDMAAIMLSTGTTGSEGTLGGLIEEGRRLRHHLREAWELGRLCSNDPVCAAHDPSGSSDDRHSEGAACHGCLYIAEPACERFNRFLDRALVVPTLGNDPKLAFFKDRP